MWQGWDPKPGPIPVASGFFAPVKKLKPSDLQKLRIKVLSQGRQVASVGGMLLFGKDRHKDFPDAYLQAGAFAGNDKSKIVDTQEFRDPLPGLMGPALGFINRQLRQGIEIRGSRNTRVSEMPPLALREALINALVHTDYSQKGAPIRVACVVRGLKAPVLEDLGGKVRLTLSRTRQLAAASADPAEQKILEALKAHGALRPQRASDREPFQIPRSGSVPEVDQPLLRTWGARPLGAGLDVDGQRVHHHGPVYSRKRNFPSRPGCRDSFAG